MARLSITRVLMLIAALLIVAYPFRERFADVGLTSLSRGASGGASEDETDWRPPSRSAALPPLAPPPAAADAAAVVAPPSPPVVPDEPPAGAGQEAVAAPGTVTADTKSPSTSSSSLPAVSLYIYDYDYINKFYGGNPSRWIEEAKQCKRVRCDAHHDHTRADQSTGSLIDRKTVIWESGKLRAWRANHPSQYIFTLTHEPEHENFVSQRAHYDYKISYVLDSDVPLPYACSWLKDIVEPEPSAPEWGSRLPRVAMIISNCAARSNRLDYIKGLMAANVTIDSFGGCLRNQPEIKRGSFGEWEHDKMAVMNKYMFAIAMENDFYPHYVTEKVYHALRSKCIPLFLGAKEVDQVVPGPKSLLKTSDYTPIEMAAEINKIIASRELYESYFAWDLKPLRKLNNEICSVPFVCRVCEKMAIEIQKKGGQ